MDKVNMTKNKNRRGFFRIYDEVNLFYEKIDESLLTESHPNFDHVLNTSSLSTDSERGPQQPDLQFNEHETCHVNISAGGMAFNCDEAFNEGDYLIIKLLLLSSMAVIVTYGKVVYSRNAPLIDIQHPYFVGAHFINMKDEDRELLSNHVNKKRLQHRWVRGIILATAITVIVAPDVVFGLLFGFLHFLFETFLHLLHLAFEFIESTLDKLVEHFLHTDLHQTQIVVFYIIAAFVAYGLYRLCRVLPPIYRGCKKRLLAFGSRKIAGFNFYWQGQTLLNKIKLIVIGAAAIICYVFFGM